MIKKSLKNTPEAVRMVFAARLVGVVQRVCVWLMILLAAAVLMNVYSEGSLSTVSWVLLASMPLAVGPKLLAKRTQAPVVIAVFLLGLMLACTAVVIAHGTIWGAASSAFIVIALVGALVLSNRWLIVLTGFCVALLGGLALAEYAGLLVAPTRASTLTFWLSISLFVVVAAVVAAFSRKLGEQALLRVSQELQHSAQLERQARDAQALLHNFSQNVPGVIFQWELRPDGQTCVPYVSDGLAEMMELTAADVRTDAAPLFKRTHPQDLPGLIASMQASAQHMTLWRHEFRVVLPTKGERWLVGQARPRRLSDGGIVWYGYMSDVTDRRQTEQALRASQEQMAASFRVNPFSTSIVRCSDSEILFANDNYKRDFGWSQADLVGHKASEVGLWAHPTLRQAWFEALQRQQRLLDFDSLWRHKDGSLRNVLVSAEIFQVGDEPFLVACVTDVTERKKAEEHLKLAASVFTHAREGITITDINGTILDVNQAFTEITGYSREEAIGGNPRLLKSGRHSPGFYALMWKALLKKGQWSGEIWNRRKNGEIYPEALTISAVRDAQGTTTHYVALFNDISESKAQQGRLEHMAHFDALTGLPNRLLQSDRLRQAMARCQRQHQSLAVVFLDLDNFKPINDRYGHAVGDGLLIELARRMQAVLREGDTLARLGGDEFIALIVGLNQPLDGNPLLERLLQAASAPVTVPSPSGQAGADLMLQVTASIGVTFYPQDSGDADQLVRHADQAMYQAKQSGKNRYHVFDLNKDVEIQTRHESVQNFLMALQRQEFVLYYQPKVNMRTGQVIGAEALIRWQHPEKGLLAPAAFLPMIENHPVNVQLGEWVIETALRQLEQWQEQGLRLPVSVNIDAVQLQQADFPQRLQALLAVYPQVSPSLLELEVLETTALQSLTVVGSSMQRVLEMGVRFALDDFGTGYSSLAYLRQLPVAVLKIDQSFVRQMTQNDNDLAIVQGVVALAKAFGREVIAEGVETAAHGVLLQSMGCEMAQGYGIAKPMPAALLPDWVQRWNIQAVWTA